MKWRRKIKMFKGRKVQFGTFLFGLCTMCLPLTGQESAGKVYEQDLKKAEQAYGPDVKLLSGVKYNYTYRAAEGTPFMEGCGERGDLLVNGKLYREQPLVFDIYNQQLILNYKDFSGATGSIVLLQERVGYFYLGSCMFRAYPLEDGEMRFCMVIYEGRLGCIYHWRKDYQAEMSGERKYYFSNAKRRSWLVEGEELKQYKGKSSFLSLLPKEIKGEVKLYMKKNAMRFRKIGEPEMTLLMEHVNSLLP